MSARDLEADDFPHGTVEGWERGCKGRHCYGEGRTCAQARALFVSDWNFRRQVLAERAERAAVAAKRRTFSADDEAILVVMAAAGRNNADIGRVLGFTAGAVGLRRRSLGLASVPRGRPRKQVTP